MITFSGGLQSTLGSWWSMITMLVAFQHGRFCKPWSRVLATLKHHKFFQIICNPLLTTWKLVCSLLNVKTLVGSLVEPFSIYLLFFISQNVILNFLKQRFKNSIIHGLNINLLVVVFLSHEWHNLDLVESIGWYPELYHVHWISTI